MSEPIEKGKIDQAPTPQNTPASVTGSYLSKGVPPTIPNTIEENEELHKKLMSNPLLLSMIQGKLGELVGTDSGYVTNLPEGIKKRVYGLKSLQQMQFKLEAEFQSDLLELERKYHAKYFPLFEKRKEYILGTSEPTSDEINEGKNLIEEEEGDVEANEEQRKQEEELLGEAKGIPGFWLTAMENLTPVTELISEPDVEVLSSLVNVRMEYLNTPGFKLIFEFDQNDFFTNKELIKSYYYQKELGYTGEFVYDHAEGCEVAWKDNEHNVTITVEKRKQRNKHTKQVRTIEKLTPVDSFFNFFNPPTIPDEKDEKEDEEELQDEGDFDEDLEERLQLDYQIGELIKDKLIPRAVDWFTGQALSYEMLEGDDEDEFEGYEDEYEEDEEDEEDEDEEADEERGLEDEDDEADDDNEEDEGETKSQPECKQQ